MVSIGKLFVLKSRTEIKRSKKLVQLHIAPSFEQIPSILLNTILLPYSFTTGSYYSSSKFVCELTLFVSIFNGMPRNNVQSSLRSEILHTYSVLVGRRLRTTAWH